MQLARSLGRRCMAAVTLTLIVVVAWQPMNCGLASDDDAFASTEIVLREGLVVAPVGRYGRSAVHTDAIEAQIVSGEWIAPTAGGEVKLPDGSAPKWQPITAGDDGLLQHPALGGGYAYFAVPSDSARVMILQAAGHSLAYINGEPRPGDPYSHGYVHLPVQLRAGMNDFLFHVGRGRLTAKLVAPKDHAQLDLADTTIPDLIVGEDADTDAAVLVLNATAHAAQGLAIEAALPGSKPHRTPVPSLVSLQARKIGFRIAGRVPDAEGDCDVNLKLVEKDGEEWRTIESAKLTVRARRPEQLQTRTFRSSIDGSVQYFALVPAAAKAIRGQGSGITPAPTVQQTIDTTQPALVLTLHGAGVEAIGQAACFTPKPDIHVVAPTNRRPFGFDWEDWGRIDCLEVLDLAQKQLGTDPRRTYLTGHSMGGHGTWHIGATFPSRFAAIGPSAGWVSMWSYAGARRPENPEPMQALLLRSASPSDTLALSRNFAQHGVYILHGDKDDNVPVEQARTMRQRLAEFHPDFVYREQPGAGHWWGNPCVDWPAMFEFFAQHVIPEEKDVRHIDFITASPGVSARSHWVCIEAQLQPLRHSSVSIDCDPARRRIFGTTQNVAQLQIDLGHLPAGEPVQVELDGQQIDDIQWPKSIDKDVPPRVSIQRAEGRWQRAPEPCAKFKGPQRYGTFKDAFRNRVVFVYGTKGTPEENAWAMAKARLDAERFWYQGNASVDVLSDYDFAARRSNVPGDADFVGRNVIVYGNADTNVAWQNLLTDSPVQVHRGAMRVDERELAAADLACLFVRPRPGSDRATVGVVTGTGLAGMRLTDRLPYFVSGVAYPDCIVLGPEMLTDGATGVRAAGFFGLDWRVGSGEFVWRDQPD